jgi:hypothetical protein
MDKVVSGHLADEGYYDDDETTSTAYLVFYKISRSLNLCFSISQFVYLILLK